MYNPDNHGFRNVVVSDGISVGTTPVRLTGLPSGQKRSAIQITAREQDVYLKFQLAGLPAPTIAATNFHYAVGAVDSSPFLGFSESVEVWAYSPVAGLVNVVEASY